MVFQNELMDDLNDSLEMMSLPEKTINAGNRIGRSYGEIEFEPNKKNTIPKTKNIYYKTRHFSVTFLFCLPPSISRFTY